MENGPSPTGVRWGAQILNVRGERWPVKSISIYFFQARGEGQGAWRNLLGGKGAGLAEMTNLGIPVPPGFTITTEACVEYFNKGGHFPEGLWDQVLESLAKVETSMGAKFGDPQNPLLVSVRSRSPRIHARHDGHRPQHRP